MKGHGQTPEVTFRGGVAGRFDEARLRRCLADLGFSEADITDEIERAHRTRSVVRVVVNPNPQPERFGPHDNG